MIMTGLKINPLYMSFGSRSQTQQKLWELLIVLFLKWIICPDKSGNTFKIFSFLGVTKMNLSKQHQNSFKKQEDEKLGKY